MDVDIETLIGGIFCLGYVVYGALVKGGFWRQNWTNKGGRWVSAAEGPIFYVLMILLFLTLGIMLTLEGFNIIQPCMNFIKPKCLMITRLPVCKDSNVYDPQQALDFS